MANGNRTIKRTTTPDRRGAWVQNPRTFGVRKSFAYASAGTLEAPGLQEQIGERADIGWIVTVYDNEHNTYEEVMMILMVATGCSGEEAYIETWEIDHLGKSVVHHAGEKECREIAELISKIGIQVEVSQA